MNSALPAAILVLLLPVDPVAAGAVFAVLFGLGAGLSSIVRGSVPLALFGVLGLAAVVLVHEIAEVIVILNGLRAARTRKTAS